MDKYKIVVTQYFDTYPEWTKIVATAETIEEAKKKESEARSKYYNRTLVSYRFQILTIGEANNENNKNKNS